MSEKMVAVKVYNGEVMPKLTFLRGGATVTSLVIGLEFDRPHKDVLESIWGVLGGDETGWRRPDFMPSPNTHL